MTVEVIMMEDNAEKVLYAVAVLIAVVIAILIAAVRPLVEVVAISNTVVLARY
jgi:hypothetical protein